MMMIDNLARRPIFRSFHKVRNLHVTVSSRLQPVMAFVLSQKSELINLLTYIYIEYSMIRRQDNYIVTCGRNRCRSHFFQILDSFRRYLRSKSKVVKNRAEFWTFFSPPKFQGPTFQNLYPCYDPCPVARRMENVLWDTEVIVANTLNFKANFKFSRSNFFGGPRPTSGVCYQGLGNL